MQMDLGDVPLVRDRDALKRRWAVLRGRVGRGGSKKHII